MSDGQYGGYPQPQPGQGYYPQPPPPPQPAPQPARPNHTVLILALAILLVVIAGGGIYLLTSRGRSDQPASTSPNATQVRPAGGKRNVNVSFKPGESRTYKMNMNMTGTVAPSVGAGPSTSWDMNAKGKATIVGVGQLPDGSTKIRVSYAEVQMNGVLGGNQVTLDQAPPPQEFVLGPDGSVRSDNGVLLVTGEGRPSPIGASVFKTNSPVPVIPDHEINPGDTWDEEIRVPTSSGKPLVVRTQSKFESYQDTRWGRAAKIWTVSSTAVDAAPGSAGSEMTMKGNSLVSTRYLVIPETGEVVKTWVDGGEADYAIASGTPSGETGSGAGYSMKDNYNGSWELTD